MHLGVAGVVSLLLPTAAQYVKDRHALTSSMTSGRLWASEGIWAGPGPKLGTRKSFHVFPCTKKQHISVAYILQTLSNFKLSLCSIRFQQHTAKNRIKDEHLPNLCNNIYNIRYKYLVDWLPCSLMPVILPPRLMKQTLIYKFKGSLASSSS